MAHIFTQAENNAWSHQLAGKMTSACLAIIYESSVLMVKANYKDHWTFPGGIVDEGESPKQGAIRETLEETGIAIATDDTELLGIAYILGTSGSRDRFNVAFVYTSSTNELPFTIPNDEIYTYKWVPFTEVAHMSKGKASYQHFQRILTAEVARGSYAEILI